MLLYIHPVDLKKAAQYSGFFFFFFFFFFKKPRLKESWVIVPVLLTTSNAVQGKSTPLDLDVIFK